jgi:hypothetical protein
MGRTSSPGIPTTGVVQFRPIGDPQEHYLVLVVARAAPNLVGGGALFERSTPTSPR